VSGAADKMPDGKTRRRFQVDGAEYLEVTPQEFDRLDDHVREVLQAGPGDTVLALLTARARSAE